MPILQAQPPTELNLMAWNLGFGSRKHGFGNDFSRADAVMEFLHQLEDKENFPINVIAFQEMANREYIDGRQFYLKDYLNNNGCNVHFEPSLSLGKKNSYVFGKLWELEKKFDIIKFEQGPGIGIPRLNKDKNIWELKSLYSEDSEAAKLATEPIIEVMRPLPHMLYMGDSLPPKGEEREKQYSAGRDEEDRPVLWTRIGLQKSASQTHNKNVKIYLCCLHLPTLKNEEKDPPEKNLSQSQKIISEYLCLNPDEQITPDKLGSALRTHTVKMILLQAERIEEYWRGICSTAFILAGDFNFYHKHDLPEKQILLKNGFKCIKDTGTTRPLTTNNKDRLVDNIWIKGCEGEEFRIGGKSIEKSDHEESLKNISDHYPVIAKIKI
jgi:hypothetical protein